MANGSAQRSSGSGSAVLYPPFTGCVCGSAMLSANSRAPPASSQRFLASHADLVPNDYVSPNLVVIKPDACFPQMVVGDKDGVDAVDGHFRRHVPHTWLVDPSFPQCGFVTRDEAAILFNAALSLPPNSHALEIGSHVGWSTIHIALAGLLVDAIEPQLIFDPRVLLAIIPSLRIAGVDRSVNLVPGFSPNKVEELARQPQNRRWSLVFIDGNHNGDYPLNDARAVMPFLTDTALVFFHDLVYPACARGLEFFAQNGWRTRVYHTQQILGVAWRGSVSPPEHMPDSRCSWTMPTHLQSLYYDDGSCRY